MKKKNVKYISNNSYTRVFIRPRTVTKLRTLGQLRHRSVAISDAATYNESNTIILTKIKPC